MYSLKGISDFIPDLKKGIARRQDDIDLNLLVTLDEKRKKLQLEYDNTKSESRKFGQRIAKASSQEKISLMQKVKNISSQIKVLKKEMDVNNQDLMNQLLMIPNMPVNWIPDGLEGKVIKTFKSPKEKKTPFHWEIAEELDIFDFKSASKISGSGWPLLKKEGSKLSRELGNLMIEHHISKGFIEVSPPFVVTEKTMLGSGQLPKFADQAYKTEDGDWLIPTSEVPLVNFLAYQNLDISNLPFRVTSWTSNFRREAGSYGLKTKGLIRGHQFEKVEMVSVVKPEDSKNELDFLVENAESLLELLDIPYRRRLLGAADLGFSSSATYDLEIPMPSDGSWMEISSISICDDFQSRRAGVFCKDKNKNFHPCLLNGTGLAIGRLIAAILEHCWNGKAVVLPKVLQEKFKKEELGL
ncbi:serine--tRNA ligase [bacterium]|nr:serine--tRNA ligase [bacterium]